MKQRYMLVLSVLALTACGGKDTTDDPGGCEIASCSVSTDCNRGQICEDGCCVAWTGCSADSCPSGQICADDLQCHSITELCELNGCDCFIADTAGQFRADATSTSIVVPGGATRAVQSVLAVRKGSVLPGATATYASADASLFTVSASGVVASATAGTTTLTADYGNGVTCTASLVNLGAVAEGSGRVFVFDDVSGAPVPGAAVVVDGGNDGAAEGSGTTDAQGVATITPWPTAGYTVSVFKANYNYLSLVGLAASVNDVVAPISARPDLRTTGGFTGKLDMSTYYRLRKDRQLNLGLVAASIPLKTLLNFQIENVLGPMGADCGTAEQVGVCYDVDIPQIYTGEAALPGGLVIELVDQKIKSHFDAVGVPGRRHGWALATDLDLGDLGPIIALLTPYLTDCTCDVTPDVCDAACACDGACGVNFGEVFDALVPLLPEFASGVKSNLPLVEVAVDDPDPSVTTDWMSYIDDDYETGRADPQGRFPKLDSGTGNYGKLELRELLNKFTDYTAPTLPTDPANPSQKFEGLMLFTGVDAPGFGFVPLGLGVGLDCTTAHCLDRANYPGDFDGEVNGGTVCLYDTDEDNRCDDIPGLPANGVLPQGHMGVYHAAAHSGLEGSPWTTFVAALPISSVGATDTPLRLSAYVLREEPGEGAQTLPDNFPSFGAMPQNADARSYAVAASSDETVTWLSVLSNENDAAPLWNVYFAGSATFKAPAVTGGMLDPFPAAGITAEITATQVGFKVSGGSLTQFVQGGRSLNDLPSLVEAVTIQAKNVSSAN